MITPENDAENRHEENPAITQPLLTQDSQLAVDSSLSADTITPRERVASNYIQKPSSSKKTILLTAAAMTLLFIVIAAIYYLMVLYKPSSGGDTQKMESATTTSTQQTSLSNAYAVVTQVKSLMKASVVTITQTNSTSGSAATGHVAYTVGSYKPDGRKFATSPGASYGYATKGDASSTDADYTAAADFLGKHSFIKSGSDDQLVDGNKSVAYTSKDVICSISKTDLSKSTFGSHLVGIGCADTTSYAQVADVAQVFYDAYAAAKPDDVKGDSFFVSAPKITDQANGYKNATVSFSGFYGLFYQEPSSDWKFLTGGQDTPSCDTFNTTILKKAFSGQQCYDKNDSLSRVTSS